jgi:acetyl esterase/lipase
VAAIISEERAEGRTLLFIDHAAVPAGQSTYDAVAQAVRHFCQNRTAVRAVDLVYAGLTEGAVAALDAFKDAGVAVTFVVWDTQMHAYVCLRRMPAPIVDAFGTQFIQLEMWGRAV